MRSLRNALIVWSICSLSGHFAPRLNLIHITISVSSKGYLNKTMSYILAWNKHVYASNTGMSLPRYCWLIDWRGGTLSTAIISFNGEKRRENNIYEHIMIIRILLCRLKFDMTVCAWNTSLLNMVESEFTVKVVNFVNIFIVIQ